jgi:hypothetical protein
MRLKEESKLKKEASSSSSISIPNNKKEGPKYNFNFGLNIGNKFFEMEAYQTLIYLQSFLV